MLRKRFHVQNWTSVTPMVLRAVELAKARAEICCPTMRRVQVTGEQTVWPRRS